MNRLIYCTFISSCISQITRSKFVNRSFQKISLFFTLIISLYCFNKSVSAHEHVIELFNASGEKTVYRHHPNGTLCAIENYQTNGNLTSRETFYWENNGKSPARVQASSSESENGELHSYSTFSYDSERHLECEIHSDEREAMTTSYMYSPEGYVENPQPDSSNDADKSFCSSVWEKFLGIANWCTDSLETVSEYMSPLKEELSYSNYLTPQVEPVVEDVFGKGFLQFAGYYQQEHGSDTFVGDNSHISPHVRITMINGILSLNNDLQESLADLSQSHDQNNIYYVFRATEGWTKDILNGTLVKWGYTSKQARLLAKLWIDLIEELGGPDSDGIILHYAHSIGALDTYSAQFLLTPEQRRMIHVVTIGSPAMIPNEGFASVVNYASRRDGVCFLDPFRFIGGFLHDDHNIIYLDTFWGAPLVDHPLSVETYQTLIKELGKKFLENYKTVVEENSILGS